jgi:hypothetical protein
MDKIVFSRPSGFGKLQYTKKIWSAWSKLRKHLEYKIKNNKIPGYWAIEDAIKLTTACNGYSPDQLARIVYFLGRLQITTVKNLWNSKNGRWENFNDKCDRIRGIPEWVVEAIKRPLTEFQQASGIDDRASENSNNWKWKANNSTGMKISASKAYLILSKAQPDLENLNRWWNSTDTPPVWKARWLLLWCADIALRGRTFIWRIIANGLFTNARASKFVTGVGKCNHCNAAQETIQHLFFECPFAREVWSNTARFFGAQGNQNLVSSSRNFLELLDHCLGPKAADTARLIILNETAFLIWKV